MPERVLAATLYAWFSDSALDWNERTESEQGYWIDKTSIFLQMVHRFYRLEDR